MSNKKQGSISSQTTKRRHKKGGNPDWIWGCFSGGKKRTNYTFTRKNKRKSRRHKRH
jgi:hypothetical protein